MKNTENNNNDNSIGFFETIEILILYKKNIFIFFIIFFLLSFTYVYISNKEQKNITTSYTFSAISGLETKNINELNYLVKEIRSSRLIKQTLVLSGTNVIGHDDVFEENIIYGAFDVNESANSSLQRLIPKVTVKDLFNYYYILINSKKVQEAANDKFLKKYPNELLPNVKIHSPSVTESIGIPFFVVEMFHSNQEIVNEYSKILFQELKDKTLSIVHENIKQAKLFFMNNKEKSIKSLQDQNIILQNEFKTKMKEIILNLEEQATIARKMKIAMPPELSQSENVLSRLPIEYPAEASTSTALIFNSSANYNYLRGYISLEEEISLIKKRSNAEDFVPIIRNNLQAINKLEDKEFGSALIEKLDGFDISLINFYNLTKEESQETAKEYMGINKYTFILLFSFFGIFLGIIFSILNYSYKKYKSLNI